MKIDNSQLNTYKNCPEQYRLKYIEQLRKRQLGEESHDKEFGGAIHAGIEQLYLGRGVEAAKRAFTERYGQSLMVADKAKTPENGLRVIESYAGRWLGEDANLQKTLAVEVTDNFMVGGVEHIVKIDRVFEQQGNIYFMDHKTTGKTLSPYYWGQFEPNSQITAYTAYCQEKYGDCAGGLINAISVTWRDKAKLFQVGDKEADNYSIKEVKYSKYYKSDMVYASGLKVDFKREIFNRTRQQVKDWREQTEEWCQRLAKDKACQGTWLKNEGGCYWCEYKDICNSLADEQIIEAVYEKHNATEYLNERGEDAQTN